MASNYRYVRFKTPQGIGYALFLVEFNSEEKAKSGSLTATVSAAFCNPNDDFLKNRARDMVNSRMTDGRGRAVKVTVSGDKSSVVSNKDFETLLGNIMNEKLSTGRDFAPNWARRALAQGKVKFGLTVPNKPSKKTKLDNS